MKKLFALIPTLLLLLSICACNKPCTHEWELLNKVDRSCTVDGHQDFRCTLCGETYTIDTGKATGHTPKLEKPKTIKASSCTAVGEGEQECATCGEKYKVTIPMKDHYYKNHLCTSCGAADQPIFFTDMNRVLKSGGIAVYSANIHNYTGKALEFVEVTLELLDKKGNIIDTDWTYAVGSEGIKNKSKAYFDIWYSGVDYFDVDSWVLRVKDYDVAG